MASTESLDRLIVLEQEARQALMVDRSPDSSHAVSRLKIVLEHANNAHYWGPASTHWQAVASAEAHLGFIAHRLKAWDDCIAHFDASLASVVLIAGVARHLEEHAPPSSAAEAAQTTRRMLDRYAQCLIKRQRSEGDAIGDVHSVAGAHRRVFQHAVAAGVLRHEWQRSVQLSPASWQLRAKPWWSASEAGAQQLVAALQQDVDALAVEATTILVHRRAPVGVPVQINQEVDLTQAGQWFQLHVWAKGRFKHAEATPRLSALLAPFQHLLHPQGHAKLSDLSGGTRAYPHAGPMDTKLRLHFMLRMDTPVEVAEICVGGEVRTWKVGEALVFDDSFEHSVLYEAGQDSHRIVLIVDLKHPDVPRHQLGG